MQLYTDQKADLWLAGTKAMVTANSKSKQWDQDFTNPLKAGRECVIWTKNNFIYLRLFVKVTAGEEVQMYGSKKERLLYPRTSWFPLYTDCALKSQPVRVKDDNFAVNAHPFFLSGLYDWTGYTLIGHLGKDLDELPETISEDYFKQGVWAIRELQMEKEMPFIINYSVSNIMMQKKRLCTSAQYKYLFDTEVTSSMIRELNVKDDDTCVLYNGTGRTQVTEKMTIYFTLKSGMWIPDQMEITTEKAKEEPKNAR